MAFYLKTTWIKLHKRGFGWDFMANNISFQGLMSDNFCYG